jgi:hypothetical protein
MINIMSNAMKKQKKYHVSQDDPHMRTDPHIRYLHLFFSYMRYLH